MYDEIKHRKISDLPLSTVNTWIEKEVVDLVNDFGQNMPEQMLVHTCERLRDVLLKKYRSWAVGDVHAAFQTGLSGGYGSFMKVTVRALLHFLNQAQITLSGKMAHIKEAEARLNKQEYKNTDPRYNTPDIQFISWLTQVGLYIDCNFWNPFVIFSTPEEVKRMAQEYVNIKTNQHELNLFKKRIKSTKIIENEQAENPLPRM